MANFLLNRKWLLKLLNLKGDALQVLMHQIFAQSDVRVHTSDPCRSEVSLSKLG